MQDLLAIIRHVRANPEALNQYGYLSTAEALIFLVGLGTPAAMRRLAKTRYPTLPEAWARIGERDQAIVLEAWRQAALS